MEGAGEANESFDAVATCAVAGQVDALTYAVPIPWRAAVRPGVCVTVPLRGRAVVALVLDVAPKSASPIALDRLKAILDVQQTDALPSDLVDTVRFLSSYYQAPLGMAARAALPVAMRRTGLGDDVRADRHAAWVGATWKRPWPPDLPRAVVRLLHRIEAEGAVAVADLRRRAPPDGAATPKTGGRAAVPQAVLDDLEARGLVRQWRQRVLRDPLGLRSPVARDSPPTLHADQARAVDALSAAVRARQWSAHLLHGVTGSGKTEVYLQTIAAARAQGRGAIVLVPEIALTPQLIVRFRARFGDDIAALHSAMSEGERLDTLDRVRAGERRIVIGPRSALFAPIGDLGVVVVDECHDASYKQQSGLRYHARDAALVRARAAAAVCILGSATPGCEEWNLQRSGKLTLHTLPVRAVAARLPAARLVDLRTAPRLRDIEADRPSLLSEELVTAVAETVERGDQAMLLHNRRGFATSMVCRRCGLPVECPECAVALTWHKAHGRLRCHWCDLSLPAGIACPACGAGELLPIGAGTERVEATLSAALADRVPGLKVARFDRDTASGQRLLDTLRRFRERELDVLVGTQMLAKGHDFPAVTLVGVLLAEEGLRVPDFRATERVFQLITQVAGRAGRGERPGLVIIQTCQPDHPAIQAALHSDLRGFVAEELAHRARARLPPYSHLALVEARHGDAHVARSAVAVVVDALRSWGADVRGPVMASVPKVREVWRVHALARADERRALHAAVARLRAEVLPGLSGGVTVTVDVDPTSFS